MEGASLKLTRYPEKAARTPPGLGSLHSSTGSSERTPSSSSGRSATRGSTATENSTISPSLRAPTPTTLPAGSTSRATARYVWPGIRSASPGGYATARVRLYWALDRERLTGELHEPAGSVRSSTDRVRVREEMSVGTSGMARRHDGRTVSTASPSPGNSNVTGSGLLLTNTTGGADRIVCSFSALIAVKSRAMRNAGSMPPRARISSSSCCTVGRSRFVSTRLVTGGSAWSIWPCWTRS